MEKKNQRFWQLFMAVVLILAVFLVEMVAVSPKGIYSYTRSGTQGFFIGDEKTAVLSQINKIKSIRFIETCFPKGRVRLSSRKAFDMVPVLADSVTWQCWDRKKGAYYFLFKKDRLFRILYLNDLPENYGEEDLFFPCFSTDTHVDDFLNTQKNYPVFHD
ncbi:MAG: hypothetical protein HUK40_23945 [Desulfobacter sp.]|nr:hypothetical protein [Desulfobacter sp.]WDP86807.1 MAG: hypothetical protein HUN05_18145 [Desulfobacter sp.]